MTSSYRGQQSTNYLATEADLSGAVNKEIDAGIKDTQAFYDQMVELEKLRFENRDKNLELLSSFTQKAGALAKDIREANEFRETYGPYAQQYMNAKELLDQQQRLEEKQKKLRNKEKEFGANATGDAAASTDKETKETASDAAYVFLNGSFTYNEDRTAKANLKDFSNIYNGILESASKDNRFKALDNRILNDNDTHDEARSHIEQLSLIAMQNFIRQRRAAGGKDLTLGQIRKYLGPQLKTTEDSLLGKWSLKRDSLLDEQIATQNNEEVSAMVQNPETMANDMLGEDGWITSRKTQLEAQGFDTAYASAKAFEEFGDILEPMLTDVGSGVDSAKLRILLDTEFQFNGSKGTLDSKGAPKGAKRLHARLRSAALAYDDKAVEQEVENKELEMANWGDKEHKEFLATDPDFIQIKQYKLDFMKKFGITDEAALPDYMKGMIASNYFDDEQVIIDITSRRSGSKNLPITESMVMKIKDPDKRDEQMQHVNTPELGAFTADEAAAVDERIVAITKEAKDLKDLNQAKTDQYLVTRDNAKEYYTARFKELVVGGQSRATAFSVAKRETLDKMEKGDFDQETQLYINTQATLDLQSTINSLSKDPTLIYSTEEWAGEKPHLEIAREYIRTGGRSRYPSYYLRFNFIKNADGAYLTPEEIFETRVNKVSKDKPRKDGVLRPLPERTELKDNIDDQNKLLNKSNSTKTLEVISKPENQEWMTNTVPDTSAVNADSIIRKLRSNIQRQQVIGGVDVSYKQQTTISDEDNAQLLEAVPELKDTPFLHFNNLSPAAAKALLQMTPIK